MEDPKEPIEDYCSEFVEEIYERIAEDYEELRKRYTHGD